MSDRKSMNAALKKLDEVTREQAQRFLGSWDMMHGEPVTKEDWDIRNEALEAFLQWGDG